MMTLTVNGTIKHQNSFSLSTWPCLRPKAAVTFGTIKMMLTS